MFLSVNLYLLPRIGMILLSLGDLLDHAINDCESYFLDTSSPEPHLINAKPFRGKGQSFPFWSTCSGIDGQILAIHSLQITPNDFSFHKFIPTTFNWYYYTKAKNPMSTRIEQNQLRHNYCYRKWYRCLKNSVTQRRIE